MEEKKHGRKGTRKKRDTEEKAQNMVCVGLFLVVRFGICPYAEKHCGGAENIIMHWPLLMI